MEFDIKKIPVYKRALSYLRPVWLRNEKSVINLQLEVLLYRGRFQLATGDALYSDGAHYTPALTAVRSLRKHMPAVKSVLIMGAGLGSMVQVVKKKGYNPRFTLVEIDKVVLRLAMDFLTNATDAVVEPVCADAMDFMRDNKNKFDLIFIDIFDSRTVPDFATSTEFLTQCRNSLTPGGNLAFNYIVNDDRKWAQAQKTFAAIFPDHKIIESSINRILVTTED